ncbi:MAG: histidine kinase, partial [Oscillospiraceae bacterium]
MNITKSDEIVQKSADGVLYEDINSYNTLIAYSKTNNQGWKLLEIAKTSDVYHYLYSITIYFIVIFLIFYLIALLLARFLSNLITSPITALSMHMFNLKGTNLSDKLEVSYENEIGKLIDSYNNMITKIDELMKESAKQEQLKHQTEIEILQTKVMSLQSQINPHFLYNTLYSISWKALDEGAPSVSELLNDLSRLYKSNLYTNTDICTIDKELNQVILYINLQKKCFSKKFDFSTEIQQDLLQLYIPRFILQPFVENAFVHA